MLRRIERRRCRQLAVTPPRVPIDKFLKRYNFKTVGTPGRRLEQSRHPAMNDGLLRERGTVHDHLHSFRYRHPLRRTGGKPAGPYRVLSGIGADSRTYALL